MSNTETNDPIYRASFQENDRLIGLKAVLDLIGLSRSRIYALMLDDNFPRPIKIGKHRVVWLHAEVMDYINNKINERNMKAIQMQKNDPP